MNPWNPLANEIFLSAVSITDPTERIQFIETACEEDHSLRSHIISMLDAYESAGQFLAGAAKACEENADDACTARHSHPHVPKFFRPGQCFADQFIIREILGWGGMGIVARAEQTQPIARQIAIKIMRPESQSPGMLSRFEQERKVLALMQHPNIAKILQAGYVDPSSGAAVDVSADHALNAHPYLIMEYIDGQPIHQFCDQQRQNIMQRIRLMLRVCSGVQHAHSKGIIHRDIKPSNILIETIDGQAVPKLIDFGVAKPLEWECLEQSWHTGNHHFVGTLDYMSPEQTQLAGDIDTRTDIYSLGAVLYELLTGSVPLVRDQDSKFDLLESLRSVREFDPPRPSVRVGGSTNVVELASLRGSGSRQLVGLLKGDLDWISMKALEKDRERRYPTASQVADDLQRFLDHEPVSARSPSIGYRLRKTYHRHRLACVATAAMLLLLITGIIGTSLGFYRSTRNARRAELGQQQIGQLLAKSYFQAAKTAVNRGQWSEAIENLDRIELGPTVDQIDSQLLRLSALNGQNRIDDVRQTLGELEHKPAFDSQLAQIRLWQADLALIDGDTAKHRLLVRQALELQLPDDDRQYALSLAASATPESIDHLQQALTVNPFHHRAHQCLPILLVSLGRFDDARAQIRMAVKLFPSDPIFVATESVILTLQGNLDEARQWLEQNANIMSTVQHQKFESLLATLDQLQTSMNLAIESPTSKLVNMDVSSFPSTQVVINEVIRSHSLRIPLVLQENLSASVHAVGATYLGRRYETVIETLQDVSSRHPDGLLFYLTGSMLSLNGNWTDAEQAFQMAVEYPSCFSAVKPKALQGQIMACCATHLNDPINAQQQRALGSMIAQRLASSEPTPEELGQLSKAAKMAGDLNLAQYYSEGTRLRAELDAIKCLSGANRIRNWKYDCRTRRCRNRVETRRQITTRRDTTAIIQKTDFDRKTNSRSGVGSGKPTEKSLSVFSKNDLGIRPFTSSVCDRRVHGHVRSPRDNNSGNHTRSRDIRN